MSVDPYKNSAGPTDPGSWNRYAYTRGDPINRIDRTGKDDELVVECDDPSCAGDGYTNSTDTEGGDWNYDYPCGENGLVEVPGEGCVAVAATSTTESSAALTATSLDITADCWDAKNNKTGLPSRDQQFTAFDGSTKEAGQNIVITEDVSSTPYGPFATSLVMQGLSGTGGVFNDQKGLGLGQFGTYTLYQSFMVSVNGGTPYAVPIVLANGTTVPYLTYTLSATNSGFLNFLFGKPNYDVVEYGQGKKTLSPCK